MDLERFVEAQDEHGTYEQALAELRSERKVGHWMWFVFPQLAGLGRSPTAQHYAIASLDEARQYLAHPVLGPRLHECCVVLMESDEPDAERMFGGIDAMKLRSSMTLFHRAAPDQTVFPAVLDKYFGGVADERTDELLRAGD